MLSNKYTPALLLISPLNSPLLIPPTSPHPLSHPLSIFLSALSQRYPPSNRMAPRPSSSTTATAPTPDLPVYSGGEGEGSVSQSPPLGQVDSVAPTPAAEEQGAEGKEKKEKKDKVKRKKSQRPSWSCTECTRRKIKCDRIVPGCNQCQRRGKVALCRLEQDDPAFAGLTGGGEGAPGGIRLATSTEYTAITQSISAIRLRLFHLERVIQNFVPQPGQIGEDGGPLYAFPAHMMMQPLPPTTAGAMTPAAPSSMGLPQLESGGMLQQEGLRMVREENGEHEEAVAADDGEVEAAIGLEFMALGRDRKQDHWSRSELRRPASEEEEEETTSPAHSTSGLPSWSGNPQSHTNVHTPSDLFPSASLPDGAPESTGRSSIGGGEQTSPHIGSAGGGAGQQPLMDILPSKEMSDAIVLYSLDRVGWQHGAVHSGSFLAECAEFHAWGEQRGRLVNQAWLALYFAVLCVGVKHMSESDGLLCGLSGDDLKSLPQRYFDASISALHRSNFLAKHSIYSVQTVVIVVLTCQDVGGSDLIATLLACAIRIAIHLNIHRFASDAEWERSRIAKGVKAQSELGIKQLIDREVRKRLWCALCTEDWVSIPYRRSYTIFPSHFTTPLPANVLDSDLSLGHLHIRGPDEPTPVSKLIVLFKTATCVRRFFEDMNSSNGGLSYDLCLQIDREIREIMLKAPRYLQPDAEVEGFPPYVAWMRHYFILSVSHKLLVIHRVFLGRSFRDPRYGYSRKAAIDAARSMIGQLVKGSRLPYQHIWTIPYHTIVASTTLILDIFQCSLSDPLDDVANKRREVELAIFELQVLAPNSPIAARGVQLLTTLLGEEAKHRRTAASSSIQNPRKRKAPSDSERFGDVAKRVVSNARGPGSGGAPSSNNSTSAISPTLNPSTSLPPYYLSNTGSPTLQDLTPLDPPMAEGALTQDAFDSILLSGLGAQLYMGSGSPGAGNENPNVDFWRMLDATFEPVQAGNGGMAAQEQEFGMLGVGEGGAGWSAEMPFEFGGGGGGFGGESMGWP
ncbi:hypothetical protein BCR35DRAFT_308781 [Leucosporidium creatinivorum]|uniref:Zn(2)-C6 fungal-type domain-containing protein n=1 Tax=Leucosporidium creatinivorum TaxID=106004 RepID=A0A1Y2DXH5_9BASI|nr:hypothetical protein BCR35DRAFT_308781 [Leucosporidium creatinivorum]